jgi:hypothetical protein
MKSISITLLLAACFAAVGAQKKEKPWTEWSRKDAEKILGDSPWGQTQTETDTSEMFYRADPPTGTDARRAQGGATNQAVFVKYRIAFLSARPVRQAFARLISMGDQNEAISAESLQSFVDRNLDEWVAVSVTFEGTDQRHLRKAQQAFNVAVTDTLRNNTYLERTGGKRVFLHQYGPPGKDGMGAKFIFPRVVDGQPFLDEGVKEVRFYAEVGADVKLNMRYKVAQMKYAGRLEY